MKSRQLGPQTTIVILTYERKSFIEVFFHTMADQNFCGTLIIADGSSQDYHRNMIESIGKNNWPFTFRFVNSPKKSGESIRRNMNNCIKECSKFVETKYVMLTCDDDIPVAETLNSIEKILDKNSDLGGCIGDICNLWIDKAIFARKNNFAKNLTWEPAGKIIGNTSIERFKYFAEHVFHAMFTVVRRQTFNCYVPDSALCMDLPLISAEWFWWFSVINAGPVHHVEQPILIRQRHGDNLSAKGILMSIEEAMKLDSWPIELEKFTAYINKKLLNDSNYNSLLLQDIIFKFINLYKEKRVKDYFYKEQNQRKLKNRYRFSFLKSSRMYNSICLKIISRHRNFI